MGMHLKFVIPAIGEAGDSILVIAGHLQTTGHREAIRTAIADIASQLGNDRSIEPCIWEASSFWGIQVADYAQWRVQGEGAGYLGLPRRCPLELVLPASPSRSHHSSTNPAESLEVRVPHRPIAGLVAGLRGQREVPRGFEPRT